MPFKIVLDSSLDINNVIIIPSKTTNNTVIVDKSDDVKPDESPPNKNHRNCY